MEMMAMRLYGPNDMRYERVPVPELGPGDVRIKVAYCGICGTDEEFYFGTSPFWQDLFCSICIARAERLKIDLFGCKIF